MTVTITLNSQLEQYVDEKKFFEAKDCATLGECFQSLEEHYPDVGRVLWDERGHLASQCLLILNGKHTPSNKLEKPVSDGDTIEVMFAVGGG